MNNDTAARGRDDSELRDEPATPAQSGSSGGTLATDVGSQDEEGSALGGDPEPTRVTKKDKVQPDTGTRADNEGANG
jgi:hypothetical protein